MSEHRGRGVVKTAFAILAAVIVLGVIALVAALIAAAQLDKPMGTLPEGGIVFTVERGSTGASVARRLAERGAVRSELLLRTQMKVRRVEDSLKAGDYRITGDMSGGQILEMLVEGRQLLFRVSIPEGLTVRQVGKAAEEAGIASESEVVKAAYDKDFVQKAGIESGSLAGYLYPDTYLLPKDAGAEALLGMMVENYRRKLAEQIPESANVDADEARRRLIIASIVEREYRRAEEAPLMAGVFYNRLKIGMALQSCATVVYVLTERMGKPHPTRLFDRDLAIRDPFNTYAFPGLPPEPICNPGMTALKAAYRPAPSDNLYFRLVDEMAGRHYFSNTLDEHIKAAALAVKPGSR